jgi:hypothetical protein
MKKNLAVALFFCAILVFCKSSLAADMWVEEPIGTVIGCALKQSSAKNAFALYFDSYKKVHKIMCDNGMFVFVVNTCSKGFNLLTSVTSNNILNSEDRKGDGLMLVYLFNTNTTFVQIKMQCK